MSADSYVSEENKSAMRAGQSGTMGDDKEVGSKQGLGQPGHGYQVLRKLHDATQPQVPESFLKLQFPNLHVVSNDIMFSPSIIIW